MNQAWVAGRERSNATAMRMLVWIAFTLGRSIGRALLYPICAYFLVFSGASRKASRNYLGRVFDRPARMVEVFRHYHTFAAIALDRILLLRDRFHHLDITIRGEDILLESIARGESCFLLGAHLGSFEVLRTLGRERHVKVNMLMFEGSSPEINAIARMVDPDLNAGVIAMGTPASMLKLCECIGRGEWVGMLGDRLLGKVDHVQVSFFGKQALLPTAPFRVAALLERPIVLMFGLYRGGNRYDLCFERLVEVPKLDRASRDQTVRDWAQLYATRLEHYCREEPYNWFNFYDFWADARPPQ